MSDKLRIIFMGTPHFAVPALEALATTHDVIAVYCQPARPAGRGHKLQPSAVQQAAERLGIPIYSPVSFKKDLQAVAAFQTHTADLAVIAAYNLILPQAVLDTPRLGCVNIHFSLLPRWRGAAPFHRAIEAGDAESGVSIMRIEAGIDTGPVWRRARHPLPPTMTLPQLYDDLGALGARELMAALPAIVEGEMPVPQSEEGMIYAAKLTRDEGLIDWTQNAPALERKLRAFIPWPGLFFMYEGKRIKVWKAALGPANDIPSGTVLRNGVACGGGTSLTLQQVQPEGRSAQSWTDYLNGARLQVGDRFA